MRSTGRVMKWGGAAVVVGLGGVSLALLASPLAAQPATVAARIRAVESGLIPYVPVVGLPGWQLAERMKLYGVPGLSIAVIRNYRVDWAKGYGLADTTTHRPVTTSTPFSAGSISKLVTAALAMRLVQDGRLSLDAPINRALRNWSLPENDLTRATPVTLRLLLAHRGGTSQSSYFGFVPRAAPLPTSLDILSGKPNSETRGVVVNQPPGKGFSYSGGGYMVVQQALMDASGHAFDRLAADRLFRPLGMTGATFTQPLPSAVAARASWAYSGNSWFKGMPYVYPQLAPAGLYATPTDIARFMIEMQNAWRGRGAVLNAESARAMLTPQATVSTGVYREEIGLGAFMLQRTDRTGDASRYFEHTGVNAGFLAYALASVTGGNGVVIMMNNDGGASELGKELRRAVASVYGWTDFLPPPVRPLVVPPETLRAYEGRFQRGADEVVEFRAVGDHLEERITSGMQTGTPILCFTVGRDSIAFTDYPGIGVFRRDDAGRVTGIQMPFNERAIPRLRADVLLPGELLRAGRVAEAIDGYRAMTLSESQLTYAAYELLNRRPFRTEDLPKVEGLLRLAQEQFPQSGMVFSRWGDYHLRRQDTASALQSYREAQRLDPTDAVVREAIQALEKPR